MLSLWCRVVSCLIVPIAWYGLFIQIHRQEDDVRARMSTASDVYKKAVTDATTIRQEYFNFQLPRLLRVRTILGAFIHLADCHSVGSQGVRRRD